MNVFELGSYIIVQLSCRFWTQSGSLFCVLKKMQKNAKKRRAEVERIKGVNRLMVKVLTVG